MDKGKFLSRALLWFLFVVSANGLAFAERDCTHEVERSDGTKTITTDCTSSYTTSSESFLNRFLYNSMVRNFLSNVNENIRAMQDQWTRIFTAQDHSKQVMADMKEKEDEARETQQAKQREQEIQLEDSKERQEAQKQQQQDLMQEMSYKQRQNP